MTFAAIKQAVKDYCHLTQADSDIRVGSAINRHYKRITSTLGLDASRFVTRTVSTTNGVATVTFTEIEKIDRIIDATDSDAIRVLEEVSIHTIRSTQPGTSEPSRWALQNTDADSVTVRIDTLPQSTYSLQADGWTTLADLSGTQEPVFPESFHDILVWAVIEEELLKKEKSQLAAVYAQKAETLLRELRFHLADSPTKDTRQGASAGLTTTGASGGGGASIGGSAFTQTALLTFDRGAGIVPFAVAQADAPYVANLGAEFIGNVTTDRLIGRDTAGTGESEQLTVGGGIEFTGAGGIQRSALTGDVTASAGSGVTAIANDTITYAKMQNVSATSRVLGRKTAAAGDTEECTLSEVLDFVGSAAQGDVLYRGAATWTRLAAGTNGYLLQTQGASANPQWVVPAQLIPCGRLTLTTATPVTTADVTAATTLYYTPYLGNTIALYSGTVWVTFAFAELSITLASLTAALPYDVFVNYNAGVPALELTAWTNTTTRATALTTQDGVYVKTGATTRRYVGTICITSVTGQCEDSAANRLVWNAHHRRRRPLSKLESTNSWSYTTATIRASNNSTANRLGVVVGLAEDAVYASARFLASVSGGGYAVVGVGYDSTTAFATGSLIAYSGVAGASMVGGEVEMIPAVGYHYFQALERGDGVNATTFFGDNGTPTFTQSGMVGEVWA